MKDPIPKVAKEKKRDGVAWFVVGLLIALLTAALAYVYIDDRRDAISNARQQAIVEEIQKSLQAGDIRLRGATCSSTGHVDKSSLTFRFLMSNGETIVVTCVER